MQKYLNNLIRKRCKLDKQIFDADLNPKQARLSA